MSMSYALGIGHLVYYKTCKKCTDKSTIENKYLKFNLVVFEISLNDGKVRFRAKKKHLFSKRRQQPKTH